MVQFLAWVLCKTFSIILTNSSIVFVQCLNWRDCKELKKPKSSTFKSGELAGWFLISNLSCSSFKTCCTATFVLWKSQCGVALSSCKMIPLRFMAVGHFSTIAGITFVSIMSKYTSLSALTDFISSVPRSPL